MNLKPHLPKVPQLLILAMVLAVSVAVPDTARAQDSTVTNATAGPFNWGVTPTAATWSNGVPNGVDDIARRTATTNITTNLDVGVTLGQLLKTGNGGTWTIGGSQTLTMSRTSVAAVIQNTSGTNGVLTINSGLVIGSDLDLILNGTDAQSPITNITGSFTGTGNVTANIIGAGQNTTQAINITALNTTGTFTATGSGTRGTTTVASIGSTVTNITKSGSSTLRITGTSLATGNTTISGGILSATSAASLAGYNVNGRVTVSGGFLRVLAGGTGWTVGQIDDLYNNATFNSGSALSFDTTGAVGSFTYNTDLNGSLGLEKAGTGTLVLGGISDFTGVVTIQTGGILSVSNLADGGVASNIGASTNAPTSLILSGGTLLYTGTAQSTDRRFTLTAGSTIQSSGTGALNFTNTGSPAWGSNNNARALTLGGTNTDDNIFAGLITNNGSGNNSVTKADGGKWRLTNTSSTYTGATTINGGVLEVVTLANGGVASSMGQSTNAATSLVFGAPTATLRYIGSSNATTNRGFTLSSGAGGGATIESSGTGILTIDNTIPLAYGTNNQTRTLTLGGTNTGANTFSKVIANNGTGATSLTKAGAGTWVLGGANTYTGATNVNAGTLLIATGGSLNASSAVAVNSGGTLGGTGNVNGTVTVSVGGILSPGNSPGLQNMGSLVLTDGGNYNWQILDATGVAGVGFDTINLSGSLNLAGLTGVTDYNINLWSLSSIGPDVNGNATNFNNLNNQSWSLVTTGNIITGFDASEFTINVGANAGAAGFSNALAGGVFSMGLSGDSTDLLLNYTAIPEPSTYAMLGLGLGALVWLRRKNKKA